MQVCSALHEPPEVKYINLFYFTTIACMCVIKALLKETQCRNEINTSEHRIGKNECCIPMKQSVPTLMSFLYMDILPVEGKDMAITLGVT